jgi:hypothetical protein
MADLTARPAPEPPGSESLVSVLDRLLDTGIVADGHLVLSVAGVDLIYVGVRALLASMDTAARMTLLPSAASPLDDSSVRP